MAKFTRVGQRESYSEVRNVNSSPKRNDERSGIEGLFHKNDLKTPKTNRTKQSATDSDKYNSHLNNSPTNQTRATYRDIPFNATRCVSVIDLSLSANSDDVKSHSQRHVDTCTTSSTSFNPVRCKSLVDLPHHDTADFEESQRRPLRKTGNEDVGSDWRHSVCVKRVQTTRQDDAQSSSDKELSSTFPRSARPAKERSYYGKGELSSLLDMSQDHSRADSSYESKNSGSYSKDTNRDWSDEGGRAAQSRNGGVFASVVDLCQTPRKLRDDKQYSNTMISQSCVDLSRSEEFTGVSVLNKRQQPYVVEGQSLLEDSSIYRRDPSGIDRRRREWGSNAGLNKRDEAEPTVTATFIGVTTDAFESKDASWKHLKVNKPPGSDCHHQNGSAGSSGGNGGGVCDVPEQVKINNRYNNDLRPANVKRTQRGVEAGRRNERLSMEGKRTGVGGVHKLEDKVPNAHASYESKQGLGNTLRRFASRLNVTLEKKANSLSRSEVNLNKIFLDLQHYYSTTHQPVKQP